jgi:TP901 family phage tail tape measure protein
MATRTETSRIDLIINGTNANASLRDLEAAARKAKSELRGLMPGTDQFNRAAANVARLDAQLQQTRVQAGLTKSAWDKMKDSIKTTFIGNLGANLGTLGLQKIASYFTDAWDAAKKLSDQMADIGRTTGMTKEEVKQLNSELSKIDTRTSMTDLREMAIVAGQFGVAKEQIAGFVKSIDQANIVMGGEFGGNAEAVANEMSKLRNIFTDIKSDNIGDDIGFIANAINKLAQEGVATAPVVGDMANRIGGYGIQIGLTTGQVLGLSATLQELNVSSERGGTAVVKILQKMLTNTQTFANIAGMDINTFKELLNTDLFGAFKKVMEGSQKLGGKSTELAGIIKELEVQGAGASEVFAKLGSNMGMLEGKVSLSNEALTNNNSITNQAKEKQENLAGSVERLGKAWNKLVANPAIVAFFKGIVDLIEKAAIGFNSFIDTVGYNYDFFTKGKTEADRIYLENHKKFLDEELAAENQTMEQRVAGKKNGFKQLTQAELEQQIAKQEAIYKGDLEYAKKLMALGKQKEAAKNIQIAKESGMELKAAKEVLALKITAGEKGLEEKIRLTEKEIKAVEKQKQAEAKIVEKANKERISFEEARIKYEQELWQKQMYQQIDDLRELHKMEDELDDADVNKEIERLAASADRWDSFYKDLAQAEKDRKEQMLANAQEIANSTTNILNALMYRKDILANNELVKDRKVNEEKKNNLKSQLDKGLITQEQYDKKQAALDEQMAAKEAEAQTKAAKREKAYRLFLLTIDALFQTAKAAIDLGVNPIANLKAAAAWAQVGITAATPVPAFFDGGDTPPNFGSGIDGRGGFKAILHPNEYVINARQMRDPYVYNFTRQLEAAKGNISSGNSSSSTGSANSQVLVQTDPELKALLKSLNEKGVQGVWNWDYEQRTKERMADLDSRRKL